MKNLKFVPARTLFALLFVTSFFGCKESKKTPEPQQRGVEGSWKFSAINITPAYGGITDFLAYLIQLSGDDCIKRITMKFNGNGTIGGVVPPGCQTDDADDIVSEGSRWKVEGDKIVLTDPDGSVATYRLETGAATMKWSYDEPDEDDPTKKYTYTIVFARAD